MKELNPRWPDHALQACREYAEEWATNMFPNPKPCFELELSPDGNLEAMFWIPTVGEHCLGSLTFYPSGTTMCSDWGAVAGGEYAAEEDLLAMPHTALLPPWKEEGTDD